MNTEILQKQRMSLGVTTWGGRRQDTGNKEKVYKVLGVYANESNPSEEDSLACVNQI